jgi:VWFA-related protein
MRIRAAFLALIVLLSSGGFILARVAARSQQPGQTPTQSQAPRPPQTPPAKDPQTQDPPGPVIRFDTAYIVLPVIVTDRYGQFVTGLSQRDFTVREDGVKQDIATFSDTEAPFDVALLLDTSHSTQRKLGAIRKAALAFIKQLQPKDRVMIVTFDDRVRFVSELTSDREALKKTIDGVKSGFATSLYDAISLTVLQKLSQLGGRRAMVVLTDGVDTASKIGTYESTLDLISTAGVIAYAIQYETRNDGGPLMKPMNLPGIGQASGEGKGQGVIAGNSFLRQSNALLPRASERSFSLQTAIRPQEGQVRDRYLIARDFLRALALQSGARYHQAENIESTSYAFAVIANELRHQYTLAYYSTNEKRDGRIRTVSVVVPSNDLLVRTRTAFRAPKAPDEADPQK